MAQILMPKATAVWLVDNTALTFQQISEFCGLHHLEVKGIADGDVAQTMRGVDPIAGGVLSRQEIAACEEDSERSLKPLPSKISHIPQPKRKGSRYTPVARRADKPDAIAWFIRHHPEVSDPQIIKLIGTTKNTINNVRERTHWNTDNIKPVDPVTLGLCSQIELDEVIAKSASKRKELDERAAADKSESLAPLNMTVPEESKVDVDPTIDDIFRNFE